ncbi:MAG: hypothetical protein JNM19_02600 [Chitinophagaceae bacterium]|nr:hypothetical protein [Chitinophagaceae bacterium]
MKLTPLRSAALFSAIIACTIAVSRVSSAISRPESVKQKAITTVAELNTLDKTDPAGKEVMIKGICRSKTISGNKQLVQMRDASDYDSSRNTVICHIIAMPQIEFKEIELGSELVVAGKLSFSKGQINLEECRILSINIPVIDYKF